MRNCEKPKVRNGEKVKWRNGGWRRLVMLSVLLSHFLIFSFSQSQSPSPQSWRDSLAVLNKQIAGHPWSTELHLRKAAVNLELGQWEYAADEYGLVLQHEPGNLSALYYRAFANGQLRRYDLARSDYEDVLAVVPTNFEARMGLAYILQKTNHRTEAMNQLNQLVEQHPDSAIAYAARAMLERDLQQYDAALYDWEQAMRHAPDNADYLVSRVDILILQGRDDDAKRLLDDAVRRGVPRGLLREWYERIGRK